MLRIGERAPLFEATSTQGTQITLEGLRGKIVVLYFFPRAFTPGCTTETRRFRDNYPELKKHNAEVIGISMDDLATQCRFAERHDVTFPMIGDADGIITALYGVRWPIVPLAKRVTFVIDPAGVIRGVFHHELQVARHLDDVLHAVKRLEDQLRPLT